jgi:hypothetical protein
MTHQIAPASTTPAQAEPLPGTASPTVDVLLLLARRWKWLVIGPLVVGAVAFGVASTQPRRYQSSTTFLLGDASARNAESFILSPAVLDVAIAAHPDLPGETIAEKRRLLGNKIRWSVTPGEVRKTANIFYMTVEDRVPARARSVATALINQWLLLSTPRPDAKVRLGVELELTETRLREADVLLQRLAGETTSMVAPNSLQGELATPIEKLRDGRFQLAQQAQKIRYALAGGSRDVILTPPDLPTEPSPSLIWNVVASATASAIALALIGLAIVGGHWLVVAMAAARLRLAQGTIA